MQSSFATRQAIYHCFGARKITFSQIPTIPVRNGTRASVIATKATARHVDKKRYAGREKGKVVFFETQDDCRRPRCGQKRNTNQTRSATLHAALCRIRMRAQQ
ncbi:MAG: hypothetical protein AB7D37_02300 [Desulfovibrio sp.]